MRKTSTCIGFFDVVGNGGVSGSGSVCIGAAVGGVEQ